MGVVNIIFGCVPKQLAFEVSVVWETTFKNGRCNRQFTELISLPRLRANKIRSVSYVTCTWPPNLACWIGQSKSYSPSSLHESLSRRWVFSVRDFQCGIFTAGIFTAGIFTAGIFTAGFHCRHGNFPSRLPYMTV